MKLFSLYLLVSEPSYWWGGFSPVSLVCVGTKQDHHTYSGKQHIHTRWAAIKECRSKLLETMFSIANCRRFAIENSKDSF